MVAKKRASKRQTLQNKYKIIKRTKQHADKVMKGKKQANVVVRKKKKDTIPNDWPYKSDLLNEIRLAKEKMEEIKLRTKEKRREEMSKRRKGMSMEVTEEEEEEVSEMQQMENFAKGAAAKKGMNVEEKDSDEEEEGVEYLKGPKNTGQLSRRQYLKALRKTIKSADVILHVLDARDPIGTKSTLVEELVLSDDKKKLVYVLNKADLVPREVLVAWLTHFRKSSPTLPFKCNTQSQKDNLSSSSGKIDKAGEGALKTNRAIGGEELLGLLKNYCRVGDSKSIISVGIVGFPNVGKSSLINSLMRTRAVGVSSTPGFTKVSQEVILDKNIRLIDSPGIVFADGDTAATALRNCVNVEEMEDILTPIQAILDKCPQSYLMQLYSISKFKDKDFLSFLARVAKATGKLKKGGIPNTDAAARTVLHDWNNGKIRYYCVPPKHVSGGGCGEGDTMIVNSFAEDFEVDDIDESDMRVMNMLQDDVADAKEDTRAIGLYVPMNDLDA